MKKQLLYFAYLLGILAIFYGCEKTYPSGEVTVFGTVVDEDTGNPIPVAEISIYETFGSGIPRISSVSGSDGTYEFNIFLPPSVDYELDGDILVRKSGYYEGGGPVTFTRDMVGKRVQRSFTLEKKPN